MRLAGPAGLRALRAALLGALLAGCAALEPPVWEQPPPPLRTGPVVDDGRLRRGALGNGIELIVFEDSRLPIVGFGMALRRGAGGEPMERAGVAQFTARLLERGAGDRDALALARAVDDLGASLATGAGWDETTVQLSGLSRDLDALWGVFEDVVLRPRFDADEAAKVRSELLALLEKAKDDPGTLASQTFLRTLYDGHRYGLPELGSPDTLSGLGPADARAFHAQVFVPQNAIVFAAGDVRFDEIRARAERSFGGWASGTPEAPAPAPPSPAPPARRVVVVDRPDLVQAQILIGHEGIARSNPERIAAGTMSRILGQGGFSTRLMTRVRKDEGLTYGISSYFAMRRLPGPFQVSTFTRVPEAGRVVEIVLDELERMQQGPIGPGELDAVQRQSTAGFVLALETPADVVEALVELDIHGLPPDSLDTFRERVAGLRAEDVERAARELLHPERAAIVVVGPAESLSPQLERFGPVEVVDP